MVVQKKIKLLFGLSCGLGLCLVIAYYQRIQLTEEGKAKTITIDCQNWTSYEKLLLSRSENIPASSKGHYLRCLTAFSKRMCKATKPFTQPLADRACHSQDEMRFLNEDEVRGVYLLHSCPGSGNTWVRHLIEELTGVFTGSVYCDRLLTASGMWGEGMDTQYVSVVKNHMPSYRSKRSAIIGIVRNPYHAILSYMAFFSTHAHTVTVSIRNVSDTKFSLALKKWKVSVSIWLRAQEQKEIVHIVQFDNLVENFEPEVRKLAGFLNLPVSEESIQCVARNRMETYKRSKSRGPSPFSQDQAAQIESAILLYRPIWDAHNISFSRWKW